MIGSAVTAVVFDYYETLAQLSTSVRDRFFDDIARTVGADLQPGEAFRRWRGSIGHSTFNYQLWRARSPT